MTRAEFTNATKLSAWKRAAGHCEQCSALLMGKFHYDHIKPCAFDGGNDVTNCQVLCTPCHGEKTAAQDMPAIAKSNRVRLHHAGIRKDRSIRAWRKFDGSPVIKSKAR